MSAIKIAEVSSHLILNRPVMILGGIGTGKGILSLKGIDGAGLIPYTIDLSMDYKNKYDHWVEAPYAGMVLRFTNIEMATPAWQCYMLKEIVISKSPVVLVGMSSPNSVLTERCHVINVEPYYGV